MPPLDGAFDVERYDLRQGGQVLFFRHIATFDTAWTQVLGELEDAGWEFVDHRATPRVRSFSACHPDCDTRRYYGVVQRELGGSVTVRIRVLLPGEFARRPRLPGACEVVSLERPWSSKEVPQYVPVYDLDLDRDGRLDAVVPRPIQEDEDGASEAPADRARPRRPVVWDLYVMRDGCGHRVGTVPEVPIDDPFSAVGRRGLVDLHVRSIVEVQGHSKIIDEVMWWNGRTYVSTRKRSPPA